MAARTQVPRQISNALRFQSEIKAERAIPSSAGGRCSSVVGRAADPVHPVRQFALCILTAPRRAATFGSFWSLQKELAEGREFGEMFLNWSLFLVP